jgi:hypothetical protein
VHTENSVDIHGEIEQVWELASGVERWPAILPHYRFVTVVQRQGERRIVEMAARRGRVPVRWLAVFEPLPDERRLLFEHIGGAARGMVVEWRIVRYDGFVRATIAHDLRSPYAIIRTRLGEYILSQQFVAHIAGRTLARIKELVEGRGARGEGRVGSG